jgi:hypothetical protein
MRRQMLIAIGIVALVLVAAPASAGAAEGRNTPVRVCPRAFDLTTVDDAASAIYPILFDPSPFPTVGDLAAAIDASTDFNGDDLVCLKFQALRNGHYDLPTALVVDNVSNAAAS